MISTDNPVLEAALEGLALPQKTLPPWLFYDEAGSALFERITELPEYYLTRTERALLERHIDSILRHIVAEVTVVELGAGTATKTGIVLRAAAQSQPGVLYQPIDVSPSALAEARKLSEQIAGLTVVPQVANYITEPYRITRQADRLVLALYIGSSIGNFSPAEARAILTRLRAQLVPGDSLLLGTDLAPGAAKTVATLVAAYDDAQGVTAAFNGNMLDHLNRELGADFALDCFHHRARWNAEASRIEMHLESLAGQQVHIAGRSFHFALGETIHTENSYKFTVDGVAALLASAGFASELTFQDDDGLYAVTLARAV